MKREYSYLNPYYDPKSRKGGPRTLKSRHLVREYKGWMIFKRACVFDCVLDDVCHERFISATAAKNYIDDIVYGNSSYLALIAWNLARLGRSPAAARIPSVAMTGRDVGHSPLKPYA